MTPQRLQLSRQKGFRLPLGAKSVARPSKWGNPYRWHEYNKYPARSELDDERPAPDIVRRAWAVQDFRAMLEYGPGPAYPPKDEIRSELAGFDLACWCPLPEQGQPDICHAAVLLEIANA